MSDLDPSKYPAVLPADVHAEDHPVVLPADEDFPAVLPAEEPPLAEAIPETEAATGVWAFCKRVWRWTALACEWIFGALALLGGLAVLASFPIVNFITLGYLLEAGARIARTGRLRSGFIGVRVAARLGGMVLGTWLLLLPLRFVSSLWVSAQLIDPNGPVARAWKAGLTVLTVLVVIQVVAAYSRGGKLRYFFWPLNPFWLIRRLWRGGYYTQARDAVWNFVIALRLPYYFWLGFRGFVGGLAWLALPVTLLAAGRLVPVVGFLGAALVAAVVLYLPFLQIHFAVENRFRALFAVGAVRDHFRRAPLAFGFALFITVLFAVPLYLLKIEVIVREAEWMPNLVFMAFIFPARLLTGWAYGRAERRPTPRHWFFRWASRLSMVPVALVYLLFLFLSQYTDWGGIWSLYEQHAFLLPVPFVTT